MTPDVDLPPLPEKVDIYETSHYPRGFTADQMQAYAREAVMADRRARTQKLPPQDISDDTPCQF